MSINKNTFSPLLICAGVKIFYTLPLFSPVNFSFSSPDSNPGSFDLNLPHVCKHTTDVSINLPHVCKHTTDVSINLPYVCKHTADVSRHFQNIDRHFQYVSMNFS